MPITQLNYLQGINKATSIGTIQPGQMLNIAQARIVGDNLTWLGSSFKIGTISGGNIYNGFYFQPLVGNEYFVMADGGHAKVQYIPGGGGAVVDITGGVTIDTPASFDVLNSILFMCGGVNGIFKWTGSGNISAVGGSSPSKADMLKTVNSILFAALTSDVTGTIYWSNIGDGTAWNVANTLPFRKGDGDLLRGLSSLGNDLIIFKGNSIGRLSTQTVTIAGAVTLGPLTTICESIGACGQNAIDHLPDGRLIFWGMDNHAYVFDGSIPVDISDPNYPLSNIQSTMNTQNIVSPHCFVRTYTNRHEVWFMMSGQYPLIYNYQYNAWFNGQNFNSYACFFQAKSFSLGFSTINSTSTNVLNNNYAMISGDTSGNLYVEDCSSGSSPSVVSPITTLEFSIPIPADQRPNYQRFFVIPFQTSTTGQTINYYTGYDGIYGLSTSFTSTGGWDRLKIAVPVGIKATSFQIKVTYTSTSVAIVFDPAYISDEAVQ